MATPVIMAMMIPTISTIQITVAGVTFRGVGCDCCGMVAYGVVSAVVSAGSVTVIVTCCDGAVGRIFDTARVV